MERRSVFRLVPPKNGNGSLHTLCTTEVAFEPPASCTFSLRVPTPFHSRDVPPQHALRSHRQLSHYPHPSSSGSGSDSSGAARGPPVNRCMNGDRRWFAEVVFSWWRGRGRDQSTPEHIARQWRGVHRIQGADASGARRAEQAGTEHTAAER
jgi:hypothetical protein